MNSLRPESDRWRVAAPRALAITVLLAFTVAPRTTRAQTLTPDNGWRNASLEEYRQHLEDLDGVVSSCVAQRKLKAPLPASNNACDPNRVGSDDRVSGAVQGDSQPREVRYDWLRAVLASAAGNAAPAQSGVIRLNPATKNPPPAVDALLAEAHARLQDDEKLASGPAEPAPTYSAERQKLNSILAQRAYKGVNEVSAADRFREWLYNQLAKFLASLVRFGMRSPWIVWTLRVLLLLAIGVGLVWALVRIERGSRIKLIPDVDPPPGAP
jgi:hypothetical protein